MAIQHQTIDTLLNRAQVALDNGAPNTRDCGGFIDLWLR